MISLGAISILQRLRKPAGPVLQGATSSEPSPVITFSFAIGGPVLALSPAMAQDDFDINYVTELARIELTDEEKSKLGSQLGDILKYVAQLKEVNVEGVEPTAHSVPLVNVMRPDVVRDSLTQEDALRNAPRRTGALFQVPKIVE